MSGQVIPFRRPDPPAPYIGTGHDPAERRALAELVRCGDEHPVKLCITCPRAGACFSPCDPVRVDWKRRGWL